ncbi:Pepco domain-containing protein [Dapis sp. BLCC M229]|uniref:Pepco domain-containing protein n=1 Tax=Dapis sp. BLCC M229 TaxID=3400188 RepID=UPI003CEBAEBE
MSEDTIQIITYSIDDSTENDIEDDEEEGRRSLYSRKVSRAVSESLTNAKMKVETIRIDALESEMARLIDTIEGLLNRSEKQTEEKEIKLDEIELSVEISQQGQIRLLGSGGLVGNKGAIKLKFKRQQKEDG